ncbi:MAG TPA: addiction module protein [Verrucomicrobiae bacterium]|nr:addiction module protein [Verrucomicrobiae bacterium]
MNAELLAAVKALPHDEKVQLIEKVWSSLDDDFECRLSSAQQAELNTRLRDLETNPRGTVAWEDVRREGAEVIERIQRSRK